MGRQIQIMMNRADERALLEFLRARAPSPAHTPNSRA
jgi:hypothetical protein